MNIVNSNPTAAACKSGIYKITNTSNGKFYIGSASWLAKRRGNHFDSLRKGEHCNRKLQAAWNKYGADKFVFNVVEYVADKSKLIEREQHWIDALGAVRNGYNILSLAGNSLGFVMPREAVARSIAANLGRKATAQARERMSAASKGRPKSESARANMAAAQKARWDANPEQAAKFHAAARAGSTGRVVSPEERAMRSEKARGVPQSLASREKKAAALRGRKRPPEVIAKMSAAMSGKKRKPLSEVTKAKIAAAHKGRKHTPVSYTHLTLPTKRIV